MPTLKPTASGERIAALDYLRGFALLGIFVANMLFFHTPYLYIDPYTWFRSLSDEVSHMWVDILFQSSFYPLFAMLFGYGMNMQYEKAARLGKPFAPTAAKRMGILLLFGIIHAFFIWSGDILITYALMGLIFMWMLRLPAVALTAIGAVVYIVPMALLTLLTFFAEKLDPGGMIEAYADITNINRSIESYAGGSFGEVTGQRAADWLFMNMASLPMATFMILPLFMFGAAAGKMRLIEEASANWRKWVFPAVLFTASGLAIKSLPYFTDLRFMSQVVQDTIGGPLLTVGYVGLLLLLLQSGLIRKVFHPVASAGRMSLTVYLTQSIIATLIFYSYGLGYYGKVSVSLGTWLAVAIFAIQCILADLYFQKFRQGPFEQIWRSLTYGK